MTAIKHALQRDVFTPNNECLLSIVNVCKAGKKKSCFLCVTVTTERPVLAKVVMVKKSDKGDFYKRQMAWELQGLTKVDSKDSSKENPDFDLHFDKVYRWVASSTAEKHAFISCIWRLSESYLRRKVEFVNISSQLMEESVLSSESQSVPGGDKDPLDDYQKLNTREEKDIESMMEMCECAISNAEAFAGKLTSELQVLDGAIIQSIMASDNQVNNLMQLLDEALAKVDTIEGKLSSYDEMLQSIKEQMDQMSLSDRLIQTGNTNSSKLLDEIQFLVKYMDLSKEHIMALQEGDLSSPKGIEACIDASEALLQCMNIALQPGHDKLMAVTKQQDLFSELRDTFAQRLTNHLNNVFVHQGHNQSSTLSHHTIELTLPKHSPFHRDLLRYTKLMEWLKNTQNEKYEGLSRTYVDYISRLYEREIKHFFEVARIKMASTTKEERVKFAKPSQKQGALKQETESLNASEKLTGSTSSLNKLAVQSSSSSSQSSSQLDVGNMSVSDLDVADHKRFDKIFERILSELYVLCLAEQDFISNFFKLPQHPAISSPLAQPEMEELDGVVQSRIIPHGEHRHSLSSEMDTVCLMNKIFQSIETELNYFIALAVKIDNFHSLYMLVKMNHPVWMAEDVDPASYLGIMLRNVLVTVKRNFDKYISGKIRQMEEVKISKKSKVGILPFVKGFEEFAKLAETIILNTEGQGDVDVAYKKLIKAVFMNVEKVANESQKTPRDVVMMENFHHIFSTLSHLKIISLENEKREAKCKYTDHLQSYVIDSLGQPLVKLNHFFEGVKAHVAQRIHEEEVSYQFAFTKQELRRIIKKYPGKEVKKGLKNLYKKVGEHLCEEEGLLQVVWYSMQDEFIRQYKRFEELIGRCYPDFETTMDFTIQDIQEYFSSIAQSH